jgi:hypothetical protein
MFIFVKPGENYIKDGFEWQVVSIDKNLVRSKSNSHDVNDLEQLDEFNRQVVIGTIQVVASCHLDANTITEAQ